jgi:hypothetical protein
MRAFALVASIALLSGSAVIAQKTGITRTRDGHPDLQGFWDSATATPLERPAQFAGREFMTAAETAEFERTVRTRLIDALSPEDRLAADVDDVYFDRQKVVDRRTALIVDPRDGRLPALLPEAKARLDRARQRNYDDPEARPLQERCLLASQAGSSNAAPPMVPNPAAQNLYQIVQTPRTVVIYTELIHDARVIRIGADHAPANIRFWLGDSVGRWEGDTLIVDTTNFTDKRQWRGSTERLHVVERFTRLADRIRYAFTVDDPDAWTRPWSGEIAFLPTTERILEYACHEGNYAIENVLRGARAGEKEKR